ncbi:MAG TPA: alanine dehydrogenase, partial [Chloroflexi bacterium]|nr:alanine dehydrogenase [Chloroflexota bacterium]
MAEKLLTLGVIGTSSKENEHRLPIHPEHLPRIEPHLSPQIFVETGYGNRFGADEDYLRAHTGGIRSREALFEQCDIILLPKPTPEDFPYFREGQILWGWPHCVQGKAITQLGIDKRLTMIAWEAMYVWRSEQTPGMHTFYKNNE